MPLGSAPERHLLMAERAFENAGRFAQEITQRLTVEERCEGMGNLLRGAWSRLSLARCHLRSAERVPGPRRQQRFARLSTKIDNLAEQLDVLTRDVDRACMRPRPR